MPGVKLTPPIAITQISTGNPVNPTIANQPHTDLESNVEMLYTYLYNDGAGSGINADLLDGKQGSYYNDLNNAVNTLLPVNFADSSHGNRSGGTLHAAANSSTAGFLTAADKTKLDSISSGANTYSLPTATVSTLGGIIVGSGLSVNGSGLLSTSIPLATTGTVGLMKVGSGLTVASGVVSVDISNLALLNAANIFSQIQTAPDFNTVSAAELKINPRFVDLDKYDFSKLQVEEWDWSEDSGFQGQSLGAMAHKVYQIAPEVVTLDKEGKPVAINYTKLCFLMVAKLYSEKD